VNDKQLEALIFLHRCGTFKEAAKTLYFESEDEEYITPEALQYRIRTLEQELGISLYNKRQGTARVSLTREGHLFLREAITIHQRMRRWRAMFTESTRGRLSFAATEPVILHRLPAPIQQFHERFPQIELRIHSTGPEQIETMVRRGEVDFGFGTHEPESDELEYQLWRQSNMVVVTPRGHELTRMEEVTLQDLARYPLIVLDPERGHGDDRMLVDAAFRQAGIRHTGNIVMQTSNSEIIKCFVEIGLGIGIVAETSVVGLRRDLEVISLGDVFGKTEVGLLTRVDKVITAPMRELFLLISDAFSDWIEARAKQ
jgi:DNA-binding transcriptional LysR family regulator